MPARYQRRPSVHVDQFRRGLPPSFAADGFGNRHGHPDPRVQLQFRGDGRFPDSSPHPGGDRPRPFAREQLQQGARRVDLCQTRRIQGGRDPRRPDDRPGVRLALQEQCRRFLQRLPRRQRPHLFRQQAARTRTVRVRPIRSRAAVCIRRCGIRTPTGLSATSRPRESVRSCRCRSRPIRCWLPDRAIS